jgi:hypothetical protein
MTKPYAKANKVVGPLYMLVLSLGAIALSLLSLGYALVVISTSLESGAALYVSLAKAAPYLIFGVVPGFTGIMCLIFLVVAPTKFLEKLNATQELIYLLRGACYVVLADVLIIWIGRIS